MNRTPIARNPKRTADWQKRSRKPIPPVSPRRLEAIAEGAVKNAARTRADTGFSPAVKLAVRKRAGNRYVEDALCEACGKWLGRYGGEVQHRASRGSGGCTDAVTGGIANAVLLCGHGAAPIRDGCHGACEDRERHMGMDAGGFWIKHGTTPAFDPRNVAIMLHGAGGGGVTVWLAADGLGDNGSGYLYESPQERAA